MVLNKMKKTFSRSGLEMMAMMPQGRGILNSGSEGKGVHVSTVYGAQRALYLYELPDGRAFYLKPFVSPVEPEVLKHLCSIGLSPAVETVGGLAYLEKRVQTPLDELARNGALQPEDLAAHLAQGYRTLHEGGIVYGNKIAGHWHLQPDSNLSIVGLGRAFLIPGLLSGTMLFEEAKAADVSNALAFLRASAGPQAQSAIAMFGKNYSSPEVYKMALEYS